MKFAVILDQLVTAGGGFQQALTTAKLIDSMVRDKKLSDNLSPIFYVCHAESQMTLRELGINSVLIKNNFIDFFISTLRRSFFWNRILRRLSIGIFHLDSLNSQLVKDAVGFVFFTSPSALALEIENTNYSLTVWDLCHLDYPEFPEVRDNFEFERREQYYNRALRKASAIIVESTALKNKIVQLYNVSKERIHIAPFELPMGAKDVSMMSIEKDSQINPQPFIFYPAQYWSHKNHVYIIDALSILKKSGIRCKAVFCGSDKGHLSKLVNYAELNQVADLIKFEKFVPREQIESYYKNCLCVVMPSFFGPSNLPPLEAMAVFKPVFYSNLPELQSVFPDCTVPIDLQKPDDLALKLKPLLEDPSFYNRFVQAGQKYLETQAKNSLYQTVIKDVLLNFEKIFHSIKPEVKPTLPLNSTV
jgi:glycosyltransferase involved in cell wall biosynthesis